MGSRGSRTEIQAHLVTNMASLTTAVMPKRGLDVGDCEVFRFYRLISINDLVEPLSMIVPRKEVRRNLTHNLRPDSLTEQKRFLPVGYFPRGPVSNDGREPGGHDGSGVAVRTQQGSVKHRHPWSALVLHSAFISSPGPVLVSLKPGPEVPNPYPKGPEKRVVRKLSSLRIQMGPAVGAVTRSNLVLMEEVSKQYSLGVRTSS